MTALGLTLLFAGAALLVAEAHLPGGVLGLVGGIALVAGGIVLLGALGGGAALAIPVGAGLGLAAGGFVLLATRKAAAARLARVHGGAEGLRGSVGVVRRWNASDGQVFVDGALWRGHHDWAEADGGDLHEGDPVVVEDVRGLTLTVRRAERWELPA
jgi:membrane-bound ClpP family serine protease